MVNRHLNRLLFAAMIVIAFALRLTLVHGAPGDQPPHPDATLIRMSAQDSTGAVWAISCQQGKLLRWQAGRWNPAPAEMTIAGFPCGVWDGPDGGVVVGWNSPPTGYSFTWHRGDQFKRFGELRGPASILRAFTTLPGNFWVITDQREVYRLAGNGNFVRVFAFSPDQFFPYQHTPQGASVNDPILAATAGKDETWFWGEAFGRYVNDATLEGLLVYDGNTFQYHRTITGLPDTKLTFLGPAGKGRMWAGLLTGGLYSIDVQSLTAQPIEEPEPNAFRRATSVFNYGKDLYVVVNPYMSVVSESMEHRFSSVLWRRHNGQWQKVLDGVDDTYQPTMGTDRPWLAGAHGFWLGSLAAGMWWLPEGAGNPRLINWQQGFPLENVNRLYKLPDGQVLAVDYSASRSVAMPPSPLVAAPPPAGRAQVINPYSMLQLDRQFHVWGILMQAPRTLDEWDGGKWIHHPLAGNVKPSWISGLDADSEGRIWLFPDCRLGPMAILDTKTGQWTPYSSYQDALQTASRFPVQFVNPSQDRMKPIYGPNRQMAFTGACQGINYFDGSAWHLWNRNGVPGDQRYFFDGPAYFDAAGRLAVNIGNVTWEVGSSGEWRHASFQPEPGRFVNMLAPAPPQSPPDGCDIHSSSSLAVDRLGRAWWTWNDRLYLGVAGLCKPAFNAGDPDPFSDGRLLGGVLIDNQGNAFLETVLTGGMVGEYAFLKMAAPLPKTNITISHVSADVLRANFQTSAAEAHKFVWRLDGGGWSAPQSQSYADFRSLTGGDHVIEAATVTQSLMMDAVPARVTTAIKAAPHDQMASLIARLTQAGSDDEREAALRALQQQRPELALAALNKARATAEGEAKWWIDAAIQAIQQQSRR